MKIIIDASQQASHITGTDRVAFNILRELQSLDHVNQYTIICTYGLTYIPDSITADNFNIVRQRLVKGYAKIVVFPYRLFRMMKWRFINRIDLYFSFHNLSSPRIKFPKIVSSALDLIPIVFAEEYKEAPGKYRRYLDRVNRTCRVSDRFVAISKYTKKDLVQRLGVEAGKIDVLYLGVEEKFQPISSRDIWQRIQSRYNLPEHYIVTIGANEPRKNVVGSIEAYSKLPQALRNKFSLVVVGKAWRNKKIEQRHSKQIIFTGFVEDEDLPAIYSFAKTFIFLSIYEGFGLPILEAMACGTPVISSNNSSLPEVVGNAAFLVDAKDTSAAATELEKILIEPNLANQLIQSGFKQARKFSWEKTARTLLNVFTETTRQKDGH